MLASALAALLVAAAPPAPVEAAGPAPAPACPGVASLPDLSAALERGEPAARLWWNAWFLGFGGAAMAQAALAGSAGDTLRPALQLGALRAGLGAASILLVPFPAAFGPARLRALPEGTLAERCEKLAAAEQVLHRAALSERLGRSWLAHAGGLAVNVSFSLWLWLRVDRPGPAALSFLTGLAASEAKIFTQPTSAIEAEQQLRHEGPVLLQPPPRGSALRWALLPLPAGLAVAGQF